MIEPITIRLPRNGTSCPHTGLSRTAMNKLVLGDNPKVKSFKMAGFGGTAGIRVIDYQSLKTYMGKMMGG